MEKRRADLDLEKREAFLNILEPIVGVVGFLFNSFFFFKGESVKASKSFEELTTVTLDAILAKASNPTITVLFCVKDNKKPKKAKKDIEEEEENLITEEKQLIPLQMRDRELI